jgi:hypothetical protein
VTRIHHVLDLALEIGDLRVPGGEHLIEVPDGLILAAASRTFCAADGGFS